MTTKMTSKTTSALFAATLLVIAGMLASCALNKDTGGSTDQDRAVSERSQKLRTEASDVTGIYEGILQTPTGPYAASVSLYTIEVDDGLDSSGRTRTKPSLKAAFVLNDSVDDFTELSVAFDRESGELTMAPDKSLASNSTKKVVSARGLIRNKSFSGEVTKEGGFFGTLNLNLKNSQATALSDQDRKDRVIKIYERIAGNYRLTVVTPTFSETDDINLRINLATNPPTLMADCKSSFGYEVMNVSFDSMTKPATVYISTNPANTSAGRCYFSSFTGSPTSEGLSGVIEVRGKQAVPVLIKKIN